MTTSPKIPNEQTRQESVQKLRTLKRELDLLGLEMDELLSMIEFELRQQRRKRLEWQSKE